MHVLGTPPALILSQDQTLMLKALPTAPSRAPQAQPKRESRLRLCVALSFIQWTPHRSLPRPGARLTLDGLMLRVLSSFQRTDPTAPNLSRCRLPQPPSGEPFKLLTASNGCQPLFSSRAPSPVGTKPHRPRAEQYLRGHPPTGDLTAGGLDVLPFQFSAQDDVLSTVPAAPIP